MPALHVVPSQQTSPRPPQRQSGPKPVVVQAVPVSQVVPLQQTWLRAPH